MKKHYLLLILSFMMFACNNSDILEELAPKEVSTSIMHTKASNDLNWDWTTKFFEAYCSESVTNTPLLIQGLKSPFFTNNCELATDPDMFPEDGWMLVFKDLGSSTEVPIGDLPSFALYNKYSGVLRIMTYINKELDSQYTYYLSTLELASGSDDSSLFTFYSIPYNSTVSNYDPNVNVFYTGSNYDYQNVWMYSDFILSGYDSDIQNKDVVLDYNLKGVEITEGRGSAEGKLEQVLSKKNVSGFWSTVDQLMTGVNTGVSFYKSADDAIDAIDKIKSNSDGVTMGTKSTMQTKTATTVITAATAALGVVKGLISSNKSSQVPLKFDINLDINVKLVQKSSLFKLVFALNPNSQNYTAVKPVQTIPWGVFNLKEIPEYTWVQHLYYDGFQIEPRSVNDLVVDSNSEEFLSNIIANPELGNISYSVGYVRHYEGEDIFFRNFGQIATNEWIEYPDGSCTIAPFIDELAIKVTNTYNHPDEGEKQVSIIKTFSVIQGEIVRYIHHDGFNGNPLIH